MSDRIAGLLTELHDAENDLAKELLRLSERHRADHEIHHLGRDLARWSQDHVRLLAGTGRERGLDLDPEPDEESSVLKSVRERSANLLGRSTSPVVLLLRDLRSVHCSAAGVSIDWVMLAQAAQASKDTSLADVVSRCHPQTLRQMRWSNAMIKDLAGQLLTSQ